MIKNIPSLNSFFTFAGMLALLLSPSCTSYPSHDKYSEDISAWRTKRVERLKSENGWMNLVGLYWLKDGKNTFGSDSSNDLVFPPNAPAFAGNIQKTDTLIYLEVNDSVLITSDEKILKKEQLASDASKNPTQLKMGSFSFFIIKREKQYGIRLRDLESPLLSMLDSIPCFPPDTGFRIRAKFIPFDSVQIMEVTTVINTMEKYKVPGKLEFAMEGKKCTLFPFDEGNQFFLLFADATSARETYGSGRFLYTDKPDAEGNVVIDFNKAYNPPCAFTPFATCPLPPNENLLNVEIRAGEKDVHLYEH
jgi:uncharacterized protein (DUF1684 family)